MENAVFTVEVLKNAMREGRKIALPEAAYGPSHWDGDDLWEAPAYYHFLAGLVQHLDITLVAELGTHYAGSIQALWAGVRSEQQGGARFATVDVTFLNPTATSAIPQIVRLHGDSLAPAVVQSVQAQFPAGVELLFVDTIHSYDQTLENLAVYANRLQPKIIVLDDIRLNPQMQALWRHVVEGGYGECFDVSEIVERDQAGFGVIQPKPGVRWPECAPTKRWALRKAWALRLQVATRMPESTKDRLRGLRHLLTR